MMGTIVDFEQLYLDAKRRIRELKAKYEEAEACARCEHEKRLGIEAELTHSQQRISELESCLISHKVPVKTFAGGEAHYALGDTTRQQKE